MSYQKVTEPGRIGRNCRWGTIAASRWMVCLAGASAALAQNSELTIPSFGPPLGFGQNPAFPSISAPDLSTTSQPAAPRDSGVLYDVALTRDLPYVPAVSRPQRQYNLKLGDTTFLFSAGLSTSYNDNALLGTGGTQSDDVMLTPALNMAMEVPLTQDQSFRFDVGIGYRYSLNYSELSSLYVSPRSLIDYRIRLGPVLVTFFDQVSTSADTLQRVDLQRTGTAGSVDFNRLSNQSGLSVAYNLARETSFVTGYSFGLERGLNDSFSSFDSNLHAFNAAIYHRLHPRLTTGLAASYNINDFLETRSALSSSKSWSAGPLISYRPSNFLNFSASVRYSSISYQQLGGITGATDPATFVFDISATHQINRFLSHRLAAGRFFNNSLSSAQMETYSADYGITWNLFRNAGLSANVGWQNFKQSGNSLAQLFPSRSAAIAALTGIRQSDGTLTTAEQAAALYDFYSFQSSGDNLQFGISTGYQFTRKLNASLSYSHTIRTSHNGGVNPNSFSPEFSANVVTLNMSYHF